MGAVMGGLVSARLCGTEVVVVASLDGRVRSPPTPAMVYSGIGFLNASRNAGVPNVSVNAIPRVCDRQPREHGLPLIETYPFAETAQPVSQTQLVCILVIIRVRGDGHVPLMRHGPDWFHAVPMGKMNITRAGEHAFVALLLCVGGRSDQTLHDEIVRDVVPPPTGAKLGEYAAILQQRHALAVGLLLLAFMIPVFVTELEVCLTGERQQRDLVQNRLHPESFNRVLQIPQVIVATRVLDWAKGDVDLLGGLEAEVAEVPQVCFGKVRTGATQEVNLVRFHGDIAKA